MGKVFGFRMIAVENVDVETLAVNLSFTKIKLVVKIVKNLNNVVVHLLLLHYIYNVVYLFQYF